MKQQQAGIQIRLATFAPSTVNADARTAEVTWSTGAKVRRYDFWDGESFNEELVMQGANLSRLNAGAPVLNSHSNTLLNDVIGVVERAWIIGNEGRALVRFSERDEVAPIFADVKAGILRNISVGYSIDKVERVRATEKGALDTMRVTEWTPMEISLVPIPADAGAQVRGETRLFPIIIQEISKMTEESRAEVSVQQDAEPEIVQNAAPEVDYSRLAADKRIREIGKHFGLDTEAEDYIQLGSSVSEFQAAVRKIKADRLVQIPVTPRIEVNIPRRNRNLKAFENTRQGEEAAYRAGMWALATVYNDQRALRWCKDYGVRVMTGTTSSTSAVVPDEMVLPIINLRETYGVARRYCRIVPMASDTAAIPRRTSGVTAYFVGRNTATTASDAAFDDVQLVARQVAALTLISRAYAEDSAIDLADFITQEMAYAFAVKEDDCLFNGTGASTYGGIYGILPKVIDGNHTKSAVAMYAATHDNLAEIDHDDLVTVRGALPDFPGINPKWFCSKLANSLVFDALKIAGGGNNMVDMGGRPTMSYLGDEIVISQALPKVAATDYSNLGVIVYGDLNMGVTFGDRTGIEVEVLRERYAEYRQIGIQAVERFDIVVHGLGDTSNAGPICVLIGGTS